MELINLEKLKLIEIDATFKNYKKLCEVLDEPIRDGRSKVLQLKEWNRYFSFDRNGQKLTITEIYDEPRPKIDGRHDGNHTIYQDYIEKIVLNHLVNSQGYSCSGTSRQLYILFAMVNEKFGDKTIYTFESGISKFDINHFYFRANQKLNRALNSALTDLKREYKISYCVQTMIVALNSEGKQYSWQASDDEMDYIKDAKAKVLEEMNLPDYNSVLLRFKQDEYYQCLNKILSGLYDWKRTYVFYEITGQPEFMNQLSKEKNIDTVKAELNDIIIAEMNAQAEDYFRKNQEYITAKVWGQNCSYSGIFRYSPDYIEKQKTLAEFFIRV